MTYTTMWIYPWDLLDDGVETVLRRLREEIGLDAISVATSYHTVDHLRPHTRGSRMFTAHEAALYFAPDPTLWDDVALQPNVASLARERNPLAIICEAADRIGIKVESWTVCLHNSALGRRYPNAAQQNVFGDRYAPSLCPSNSDVRAYATTLVRDLAANYPLFAIELESLSFGGFGHFHGHEKIGFDLGQVGRFLMSLCFCDACRERARDANIDIDGLAARTRDTLLQIFERGGPLSGMRQRRDLLEADADLRAFVALREDIVTSLTREVKEAAGETFLVAMMLDDPLIGGLDGKALAEIADALELLCYTAEADVVEQIVSKAKTLYCSAEDLIVGLSVFVPHTPSEKVLAKNVRRALSMGVRGFSFYNYGIMPERNLEWVRAAVRQIRAAEGE